MPENSQDHQDELAALFRRLDRIEQTLAQLTVRVQDVEQHLKLGIPSRPRVPSPPPQPPTAKPPIPATPPPQPPTPPPTQPSAPEYGYEQAPKAEAPRPLFPETFESEIALKWMGRVGVVALLIGAAFFLQYAFQSGWIGPKFQVALGVMTGLALLILGEHNRRLGRRAFGEALLGGGIAIWYTSIYAAYAFYQPQLIDREPAFGLMILVTVLGAALAVRGNAHSTMIIAALGGFLTPTLLKPPHTEDWIAAMIVLFGYLAILDLGVLGVSFFQQWRTLQTISFGGTWIYLWGWLAGCPAELHQANFGVAMIFFAIFAFVPVARNLWQRTRTDPTDLILILANPAFFFPTSVALLFRDYQAHMGLFAVIMAAVYLGLGIMARRRNPKDVLLSMSWLGLGLVFVIAAVPLQFRGHWAMLGWAAEGAILVLIGHRLRFQSLRGVGLVLQAVSAAWMITLYTFAPQHLPPDQPIPIFNQTFLSYLGGLAAIAVSLGIYWRSREDFAETAEMRQILAVSVSLLALAGLTLDMTRAGVAGHWVMLIWVGEAMILAWLGNRINSNPLQVLGLLLDSVVVIWLLVLRPLPGYADSSLKPFLNEPFLAYLAGIAILAATAAIYAQAGSALGRSIYRVFRVTISLLVVWGLTTEMWHAGIPEYWIWLIWSVSGVILVGIAYRWSGVELRVTGLGLQIFALMAMASLYGRVLVEPDQQAQLLPFLNGLFASAAGIVLALAGTLLIYLKAKETFQEGSDLRPVLAVGVSLSGLAATTAELVRSIHWWETVGAIEHGSVAFAVAALWCIYAAGLVGIGIWRRYALPRLMGMAVFGVVILKVFLYDLSLLEGIWRILSFICLGVILIGVSYLYHLYGDRIQAFVRDEEDRDPGDSRS